MNCVMFIGLPAREKSTFYLENFYQTHIRINLDVLQTRRRERMLFTACLEAKQPIVIDNANSTMVCRDRYFDGLKKHGFDVDGFYFGSHSDLRNIERRGSVSDIEFPCYEEGFDSLHYVTTMAGGFVVEEFDRLEANIALGQ
ncbi:hypothetical protein A9Q99_06065 [Gammaproteobacteria bacterium 45_16_T64]|nr:hypothetical protein A9Q99_06065 [Gammaproteobacteria bacterium 45_16_T64]